MNEQMEQDAPICELLPRYIQSTYAITGTTLSIKLGSEKVLDLLEHDANTYTLLINYLQPGSSVDTNFKQACSQLIKHYYFSISNKQDVDKSQHVLAVYRVLICEEAMHRSIKESLGNALEYVFNHDHRSQYKNNFIVDVRNRLVELAAHPEKWTLATMEIVLGLSISTLAYMNSVVEPEDLLSFFICFLPVLADICNLSLQYAHEHLINNEASEGAIFKGCTKIFEILEIGMQRLMEEQDVLGQDLLQLKNSEILLNTITQYLYAFNTDKSIVTKYPTLNAIKQSILQIVYFSNQGHVGAIPPPLIQAIFLTFLQESLSDRQRKREEHEDDHVEQLLCRCIEIIEAQLSAGISEKYFSDYKIDILFALLIYSRTTEQQQCYMQDNPEKYVEMAQQYSQAFRNSPVVKIRAANLLRTFVQHFDQGLRNVIELIVIFITGSLSSEDEQSQTIKCIKKEFSNYDFWGLTKLQKLDISFMALTVISPYVKQRRQLLEIVMALLMSQVQLFSCIEDRVFRTRLIRLIGYYPAGVYFIFIKQLMGVERVLLLEGLCAFERICKNRAFTQIFPYLNLILSEILDFMDITDSIFEQMIMNNYQSLTTNQGLYQRVITKLRDTFMKNKHLADTPSKQKAIMVLNYLDKLLRRENNPKYFKLLYDCFLVVECHGIRIPLLEESFIELYCVLVSKSQTIEPKILDFTAQFSTPEKLDKFSPYNEYFLLANQVLLKSDSPVSRTIFHNLATYLSKSSQPSFNKPILPYICHTLGYIILTCTDQIVDEGFMAGVTNFAVINSDEQIWFIFLLSHLFYSQAEKTRQFLILRDQYYSTMLVVFRAQYKSKLLRKAVVLGMLEMLEHEPANKFSKEIIHFCLQLLKHQRNHYQKKPNKPIVRSRKNVQIERMANFEIDIMQGQGRDQKPEEEERRTNETPQDEHIFNNMAHPFASISQFAFFKHKIQSLTNYRQLIDEHDEQSIKQILQMQWHRESVRKILKVRKDME